jgi:hypothetical protein
MGFLTYNLGVRKRLSTYTRSVYAASVHDTYTYSRTLAGTSCSRYPAEARNRQEEITHFVSTATVNIFIKHSLILRTPKTEMNDAAPAT